MDTTHFRSSRRGFLGALALGATTLTARGGFAEDACFVKGHPSIERDGQFRPIRARDPRGHETLCLDFAPVRGSRIGELAPRWDIVLGYSPAA